MRKILLFSLFGFFASVSHASNCDAGALTILSRVAGGFKKCLSVDHHMVVLHASKDSQFLSLSVYEKKGFNPSSKPVQTLPEVAESLVAISGDKTKSGSTGPLRDGAFVGDLNGDGKSEVVLALQMERFLIDLALFNLGRDGKIQLPQTTTKAAEYFSANNPGSEASLKVIKVDKNTTVDIDPAKGTIRLGDKVDPSFSFTLKVRKDGKVDAVKNPATNRSE